MMNDESKLPPEDTVVDANYVDSTTKQANIKLLTKEISVFVNEYGRVTPILIVGIAKLDRQEYAALFDTITKKAYAVEVIREKGEIKYFKDLDGIGQDEEWAVVSNFFLKEKVYDYNRISFWIWNTTKLYQTKGVRAPGTKMSQYRERKILAP